MTAPDPTGRHDGAAGDPRGEWRVVTVYRFPHGLRCMECDRGIQPGQPFGSEAHAMTADGEMIAALVCVYCGPETRP